LIGYGGTGYSAGTTITLTEVPQPRDVIVDDLGDADQGMKTIEVLGVTFGELIGAAGTSPISSRQRF